MSSDAFVPLKVKGIFLESFHKLDLNLRKNTNISYYPLISSLVLLSSIDKNSHQLKSLYDKKMEDETWSWISSDPQHVS